MSHRAYNLLRSAPFVLAAVFCAYCGGPKSTGADPSGTVDAGLVNNNNNNPNNNGSTDAGLALPAACTAIASWTGVDALGAYVPDPTFSYTLGLSFLDGASSYQALQLEDYHAAGVAYPKQLTFTAKDKYFTCDVCVTLWDGCVDDPLSGRTGCQAVLFPQSGSITVSQSDQNADAGSLKATAQNMKLVEWLLPQLDGGGDMPKPNGRCYEINSASWNVSWPK